MKPLRKGNPVKDWTLRDGIVYYKERLFVPRDDHTHELILEAHHDTPTAGHPGQKRTLELIS